MCRSGSVRAAVAVLALGLSVATPLVAQSGFDQLYAEAEVVGPGDAKAYRAAHQAAYSAFSRLSPDGPEYRRALVRGAYSALRCAQFAAAVELLAEVWRRDGGAANLLTWRLQALAGNRQPAAAIQLARAQEEALPGGVRGWLIGRENHGRRVREASQLLLQGNTADGLWVFEALARAYPEQAFALADLALTQRRLGRLDDARSSYRAALALEPGADWLWCDFGLLLKGEGKVDVAAKAFLEGLRHEKKPGQSPAATNLGVLARRTGGRRGRDPSADLRRVLRARPEARLARRVYLDLLAHTSRQAR